VQSNFGRIGPGGGGQQGGGLIYDDAIAIQDQVDGVAAVVVEQNSSQTVKSENTQLDEVSIVGSSPGLPSVRDLEMEQGRYFNEQDVQRKQKVAVLGHTLAQELFGDTNPVGQYVTVGSTKLAVIGVMAQKGSVGGTDFDSRLYTPITVVFQKFTPSQFARIIGDRVFQITVEAEQDTSIDDIITQIELLLVKRHGLTLDTADFSVTTQSDIIDTRESTTAAFRNLLAWVAGVSLIVGGIGIMNIMLVSVTERTREIGLRQSVGATPNDIRLQFLIEALLLSIVGGLIGVVVGVGGSYLFSAFNEDMRTVVSIGSVLLAFSSAAAVGSFFGFYPANQAAKLDPIEALRYE
jgi:putative ABC transport system permease protein